MRDTIFGTGSLWLNNKEILGDVDYEILVEVGQEGRLGRITGMLNIDPMAAGMRLMMTPGISSPNADLTLHLDDGRVWHCVLKDNSGQLLNGGGFDPES